MIRDKWLRLCGSTVSAMGTLLVSSVCLVSAVGAQSVQPATARAPLASMASSTFSTAPSFLVAPSFSLGYAPSSVAAGELTQSGKLDLVTANYQSGEITVFLGSGQGNFSAGVQYAAGPNPSSVAIADINGDGHPDVLVINDSAGTLSVLLGNGDGTLQPLQTYNVGFNPSFIVTGDFSGSGKIDVAVAGKLAKQLAILVNGGSGNLQPPISYALTKTPLALTAADFNSDGHNDLALANADGTVSVLLGQGSGVFHPLQDLPVASSALSSIVAADFNQDGKIDLAVTQPGQKLASVLIGNGDGTFAAGSSYSVGNEPVSTVVADVNGDGVADLAVINKGSNTFSVLTGNGNGTFKTSLDFVTGSAPIAAAAGDFYGNNRVDLAVINLSSQTVSVPMSNGDSTYKASRSYGAGQNPVSIAAGNFSAGKLSAQKTQGLVVANYCGSDASCSSAGNVAVFLSNASGVYHLVSTYTVGAGPVSVALADVNGDKILDIVTLNRLDKTASVLLGAGEGVFGQPTAFSLAGAPLAAAVGDLNGDGKPDLAVLEDCGSATCSQPGSVEVLLGSGTGNFQSISTYSAGYSPTSVAVGDVNGDKNPDILVANRCGQDASCQSPGTATVLFGDGTGNFTPGANVALGNSPSSIALGNLSSSGPDLVVSRSTDNSVAVLKANGDGTFQAGVPYPVGSAPGPLVVSDFNGDGKIDVAVTNVSDSTVSVLYGNGDGSLQKATTLPAGGGAVGLALIGGSNGGRAGLATANSDTESATPKTALSAKTEISVMPNLQPDPPLTSFQETSGTNPSTINNSVVLTATLVGLAYTTPTGTVTFNSNGNSLSDCNNPVTVALDTSDPTGATAQATCTTQMLTGGSDSLTVFYSGDGTYDTGVGETSSPLAQTVNQYTPTITNALTSGTSGYPYGTQLTFTATVTGAPGINGAPGPIAPTGTVTFADSGNPLTCSNEPGTLTATGPATGISTATCNISTLSGGSHSITATYVPGSDPNYLPAGPSAPVSDTVSQNTPSISVSLTTGSNNAAYGTALTFTATVVGTSGQAAPTGTVTFADSGNPLTCTNSGSLTATGPSTGTSTGSCNISSLTGGSHSITATYVPGPDPNYVAAGPSAPLPDTVNPVTPTVSVTLTTGSNNAAYGAALTFTATVVGPSGLTAPTGTVTFADSGNPLTCTNSGSLTATGPSTGTSTGSCNISTLTAGSHSITATYVPASDPNYNAAGPSTPLADSVSRATPTISIALTSGSSMSNYGDPLIFTATVTGVAGVQAPTGIALFSDSASPVMCTNSGSLTATGPATGISTATCSVSSLTAGSHSISAGYQGDSNYLAATPVADIASQAVNKLSTSPLTVTSSKPTSNVNDSVTFTATLTVTIPASPASGPTGTVSFTIGGQPISCTSPAAVNSSTGVAACTTSALPPGQGQTVAASYPGDTNYASSSGTTTQNVGQLNPTLTVSSSGPSSVNGLVTFTATIGGVSFTPTGPTGTMSFTAGSTPITCVNGTTGVVNSTTGVATCATYSLTAGAGQTITVVYPGDTNYKTVTGNTTQTVNQLSPSLNVVSSGPSSVNGLVTFTATLAGVTLSPIGPTGTITFSIGAQAISCNSPATVNSSTGVATCATSTLTAATNETITASYPGDTNYKTATGTTTQTVNQLSPVLIAASSGPSSVNGLVTFTATITGVTISSIGPTGTVIFSAGGQPVSCNSPATMNPSTGVATCATSLLTPATNEMIAASYSGDINYKSASGTTTQNITALHPTLVITASPAQSVSVGTVVTFTATLTGVSFTPIAPNGTVSFLVNGTAIGDCPAVQVNSSQQATCTTASLKAPSDVIQASYSGDTNFTIASPSFFTESVGTSNVQILLEASLNTSVVNQPVSFTAVVKPPTGWTSTVTPSGGTVTFTNGATVLCSQVAINASNGIASCPNIVFNNTIPSPGTTISAAYSGDQNFGPGNPATLAHIVNQSPTTVSEVSSSPSNATLPNQAVTITATVVPGFTGSTVPTGSITFTSSAVTSANTPLVTCGAVPVTPLPNGNGSVFASCSVLVPNNFTGNFNVVATYPGDTNFTGSSFSISENVQGFTIGSYVTSGSSTTQVMATGPQTPIFVTQGQSNATDSFNPTTLSIKATAIGNFSDNLLISCSVANVKSPTTPVSDPSCLLSSTVLPISTSSSLTYTVSASSKAPIGEYLVTITALDSTNASFSQTTAPLAVQVVGVSPQVIVAPGVTGTTNAIFNTASAPSPDTLASYSCGLIFNAITGAAVASSDLTCAGPTAAVTVTGVQTTLPISVTAVSTTAQLRRPGLQQSSPVNLAAFLGLPVFALLGWVGSRKSRRKNFFRFLGLILVIVGLSFATGCQQQGFTQLPPEPVSTISAGSYYVQVIAKDPSGALYYAVVPLTVN